VNAQVRRLAVEGHLHGLGAQVAEFRQRALVDQPPVTKDADAVAERLHLAEDVRGEEHGLAALLGLVHAFPEGHLHQRVEATGRLVEDQEHGTGGERGNELNLLAVALRQRPYLLRGVELEPLDQQISCRRGRFPRAGGRGTRVSRHR
jgi:hypothetical protein